MRRELESLFSFKGRSAAFSASKLPANQTVILCTVVKVTDWRHIWVYLPREAASCQHWLTKYIAESKNDVRFCECSLIPRSLSSLSVSFHCSPKCFSNWSSVFRQHFSSPWSNTLHWSSTTSPRTRGGAMHWAGGSLSPPHSWFPSSWFTIWASLPARYGRYACAFPRAALAINFACATHDNLFLSLSEVLYAVHSSWGAVSERTREESPGTVRLDHVSRHDCVLVANRCYFTWTKPTEKKQKTTLILSNVIVFQISFFDGPALSTQKCKCSKSIAPLVGIWG